MVCDSMLPVCRHPAFQLLEEVNLGLGGVIPSSSKAGNRNGFYRK